MPILASQSTNFLSLFKNVGNQYYLPVFENWNADITKDLQF